MVSIKMIVRHFLARGKSNQRDLSWHELRPLSTARYHYASRIRDSERPRASRSPGLLLVRTQTPVRDQRVT